MPAYPVEYESDYVAERSRLTTFFRLFMLIPHCFLGIAYGIAAFFTVVGAWFAVVITGTYPPALYAFNSGVLRWAMQFSGYAFLATDKFPPFGLHDNDYPVRVVVAEPQPAYDRVKAFFRLFLMIPWAIIFGIYSYVTMFASLAAWFVIVFTGRMPDVLQRGLNFYLGPNTRLSGFGLMLTDEWPSFEPVTELEPRALGGSTPPSAPVGELAVSTEPVPPAAPAPPPAPPAGTGMSSGDPLNPG